MSATSHQLVSQADGDESTPLHEAAAEGNIEKVKHLLAAGMSAVSRNGHGFTPFHLALKNRKETAANIIIDAVNNYDFQEEDGRTALHLAVEYGCIETVSRLVSIGANPHLRDKRGRTPLHIAVIHDITGAMDVLLNPHMKRDIGDKHGSTPLHVAAGYRCADMVRKLVATGFNPCIQDSSGRTPLHVALIYRREDVAEVLINIDMDDFYFHIQDVNGKSPLHIAAVYGCDNAVKMLLAKGASTHLQDEMGCTPLHTALSFGRVSLAEILLNLAGGHDIKDKKGCTPLHLALKHKHEGIARKLITTNNIRLQDNYGKTPLHCALDSGVLNIAEFLMEVDGKNEVADVVGDTPLHLAVKYQFEGIVRKLLMSGVDPRIQEHGFPLLRSVIQMSESILKIFLAWYAWRGIAIDWTQLRVGHFGQYHVQFGIEKLAECHAEIQLMKDTKVAGTTCISYYDFTRAPVHKAAIYLENENIRDVLLGNPATSMFPYYADLIVLKIRKAEEKRILIAKCVDCFAVLSRKLPALYRIIVDKILLYLNDQDMHNLVAAFQL